MNLVVMHIRLLSSEYYEILQAFVLPVVVKMFLQMTKV